MAGVLTTASNVQCGHQGTVSTRGSAKLKVQGSPVLTGSGVVGSSIAGCTTAPSSTTKPCTSVLAVGVGRALKLRVGGQPVLLDTLVGSTNGVPPGTLPATAGQTKLEAI